MTTSYTVLLNSKCVKSEVMSENGFFLALTHYSMFSTKENQDLTDRLFLCSHISCDKLPPLEYK